MTRRIRTGIIFAALLITCVSLTNTTRAEEPDPIQYLAYCIASSAVITVEMDEGVFREMIDSKARSHEQELIDQIRATVDLEGLSTAEEFAGALIQIAADSIKQAYNAGTIEWDGIVAFAEECTF